MLESEMECIDSYPSGWTEQIHDEYCIEWVYDQDSSIFVRLTDPGSSTELLFPYVYEYRVS